LKKAKFANIDDLIHQFYSAFRILNEIIFSNKIKPFSIFFDHQQKVAFKYSDGELILGVDIANISIKELPISFLHELVHILNNQSNIIDIAGHYHNKKFMKTALDSGLFVIKNKSQGWSVTSTFYPRNVVKKDFVQRPSKEKAQLRIQAINSLKFDPAVIKNASIEIKLFVKQKISKTFFLKYECNCPAPHNSIRSGRRPDGKNALNIICQDCNSKFHCIQTFPIG
jgi:hypothetical protein